MGVPKVYKSTDGNAPVLAGVRTSLVDIFTKCLVTGYGEKAPAGWTRPYVNAELTRASFRNNPATGTGFYLMVDQATSTNATMAYFRGYELMTSESAGSFPFGYSSEVAGISATQDAKARPWVLVATDAWFYFFGYNGLTSMPTNSSLLTAGFYGNGPLVAFGDFDSIMADDAYNCMLFINFGRSVGASTAALGEHYVARAASGKSGQLAVAVHVAAPGSDNSNRSMNGACPAYTGPSSLLVSKALINNGAANTARGFLPGLVVPLHRAPFEHLSIVSLADGHDYCAVTFKPTTGSGELSRGQFLFDMGTTA